MGKGFTIVEVMIFLAISGLLLTMAIIGSDGMARRARFTDSVNTLHSTFQKYYEQTASGVNTRGTVGCSGTTSAGTDSCLLLGRIISFRINSVSTPSMRIRYVTGNANVADSGSVYSQIQNAAPKVSDSGLEEYDIAWNARIPVASRDSGPVSGSDPVKASSSRAIINTIAFLRSPNSSQIVPYYFYADDTTLSLSDAQAGLDAAVAHSDLTSQTTAAVCVTNIQDYVTTTTPQAAILFGDGVGSSLIDTTFSPSLGGGGLCYQY